MLKPSNKSPRPETDFESSSEEETLRFGAGVGTLLRPPCVVLLYGELGAGKTTLTRGLARGLQVQDERSVRSPSFTLVNEYPTAQGPLYHVDLYRLDTLRDQFSIDLEEILSRPAVVIVEWADKLFFEAERALKIGITVDARSGRRRFKLRWPS